MIESLVVWSALLSALIVLILLVILIAITRGTLRVGFIAGAFIFSVMVFGYLDSLYHLSGWKYAPYAYRPWSIGIYLSMAGALLLIIAFLKGWIKR